MTSRRKTLADVKDFVALARPHHYVKNLFIFTPLFFSGRFFHPDAFVSCLVAFISFCLLASSVYVFNDIRDIPYDRNHPEKRRRPLADGRVTVRAAYLFMLLLFIGSAALLPLLHLYTIALFIFYFILNILYSVKLKSVPIVDITVVSVGFIVRVFVGMEEAGVGLSNWLVLMTFLLAMFLALAKRRDDLMLTETTGDVRKGSDGYNLEFVNAGMVIMAAVTVVCYILFTSSPDVIERYKTDYLYLTSFWVILGILRYLQLSFVKQRTGSPVRVFLTDGFIRTIFLAWVASYLYIIYFH
jgi:decaprenyl-phosphate phosphoribosyltransferase